MHDREVFINNLCINKCHTTAACQNFVLFDRLLIIYACITGRIHGRVLTLRRTSRLLHSTACRISRTSSFCIFSTRTPTCTKVAAATRKKDQPCAQRLCLHSSGACDHGPVSKPHQVSRVYNFVWSTFLSLSKRIVTSSRKKTGIFSTRTPHRPNPIGLSVARVRKVDTRNRCIYLDGIDLIDGIGGVGENVLWVGNMLNGWERLSKD